MKSRYFDMKAICALLLPVFLLPLWGGCKDDTDIFDDVERQDILPIEIVTSIASRATRGVDYAKKQFDAFEVIHVEGTFRMNDGTEEIRYAAFQYDGSRWGQIGGASGIGDVQKFAWPNSSVSATFKAYYIYGSDAMLAQVSDPSTIEPTLLSSLAGNSALNPDRDPLVAQTETVRYGHTIQLDFIHACTYLTVEEIPAGTSNTNIYWFTQEKDRAVSPDFKNAFRLYRNEDDELVFSFVQKPDNAYNGAVYIEGTTETGIIDGFSKSSAGFFLAPGFYNDFIVGYPGASEMISYISYVKSQPSATEPEPGLPGEPGGDGVDIVDENNNYLEANNAYVFNISNSAGIEIVTPTPPPVWDEGDDPIYDVEAEQFIYSICNNLYYEVDGVEIIRPEGKISRLMHNVNIQWAKYDIFKPSDINNQTWFEPVINQGVTFDGGLHFIWNLGSPLFRQVDGTVQNLGIANVNIEVVTQLAYTPEDSGNTYDMSRQGAICGFLDKGTITNIRVKSEMPTNRQLDLSKYHDVFRMKAQVLAKESNEAHSVGMLVGSIQTGTLSEVYLNCNMVLTVENYDEDSHVPQMQIGGLVGQSLSEVHSIGAYDGAETSEIYKRTPTISVFNNCNYYHAQYYIGGIVGVHNGGNIEDVNLPSVLVDSRKSVGWKSYIGGAAGGLSNVLAGGSLISCSVKGRVFAGMCKNDGSEGGEGESYIGGLAGECYEIYQVYGCRGAVDVYGPYSDKGAEPEPDPDPNPGENPDEPGDSGDSGNSGDTGDTGDTGDNGDTDDPGQDPDGEDDKIDNYIPEGTYYATGGMFGIIINSPGQAPIYFNNLISSGLVRGPIQYIGNFAGIVPSGENWTETYSHKNIIISSNKLGNYTVPEIGASMNL